MKNMTNETDLAKEIPQDRKLHEINVSFLDQSVYVSRRSALINGHRVNIYYSRPSVLTGREGAGRRRRRATGVYFCLGDVEEYANSKLNYFGAQKGTNPTQCKRGNLMPLPLKYGGKDR